VLDSHQIQLWSLLQHLC